MVRYYIGDEYKFMNWHNWKTYGAWAIIFVIGGLQALNGNGTGDWTVIISVLGVLEHMLNGNTQA